jgi:hypothetical protein
VPRAQSLRRRLDRLAQVHARLEGRLIVLEADADRRADDAAAVTCALAEAGVEPRAEDLVVKLLRFGPPSGEPPGAVVRVGPLAPAAGGDVR